MLKDSSAEYYQKKKRKKQRTSDYMAMNNMKTSLKMTNVGWVKKKILSNIENINRNWNDIMLEIYDESEIPLITGGFEPQISCIWYSYLTH